MEQEERRYKGRVLLLALTLAGSYIYAVSSGIRNNYGIMLDAIVTNSGISFVSVSFVFAVGQLFFGLVQPFFGILAEKKGTSLTLFLGVVLMLVGMLLTPFCHSVFSLTLCLGILLPAGTGSLSYGILMGGISKKISQKTVSSVSGIVNASSGIGNTVLSPLINSLIGFGGLLYTMAVFTIPMLVMIPLSIWIGKKPKENGVLPKEEVKKEILPIKNVFGQAFRSRTYQYLMIGFFTCGFHMAIITNHLPTEFISYGFTAEASAYAFSIYGITTILGSVLSGILCQKFQMKQILGTFFGSRPVIVVIFLLTPKTLVTICFFAALLGFTGASTVPPVSGIVGKVWGPCLMATLFGFVFFIHQIGGFLSAWLGGICFDMTGSYVTIWLVDVVLSIVAAVVSFKIKEETRV